jgi:hypothetical protein
VKEVDAFRALDFIKSAGNQVFCLRDFSSEKQFRHTNSSQVSFGSAQEVSRRSSVQKYSASQAKAV